jgi:endonuclease III related protein
VNKADRIRGAFELLLEAFGPQGWWPGDSPFEIAVGAVLTQGTAWNNVELALDALRARDMLSEEAIARARPDVLRSLIRPAGFQQRKQQTLTAMSSLMAGWEGGLPAFLKLEQPRLRKALLSVRGIGPETADAISLYAADQPVFVVDAYTRRYAARHGLVHKRADYDEASRVFGSAMGHDVSEMAELHALIVRLGKEYCRTVPRCAECPLRVDLSPAQARALMQEAPERPHEGTSDTCLRHP